MDNFCKMQKNLHPSYDVCGNARQVNIRPEVLTPIVPPQQWDVSVLQNSYRVEFVLETDRLKSYDDWPISMNQKPKELSDAGFFYTGKGDRVQCFHCGGGLKDWEQNDESWEQHALWFDDCEYLKLMKGLIYIKEVKKNYKQTLSSASISPVLQNTDETLDVIFGKLCKICNNKENQKSFFPCEHVMTCTMCSK